MFPNRKTCSIFPVPLMATLPKPHWRSFCMFYSCAWSTIDKKTKSIALHAIKIMLIMCTLQSNRSVVNVVPIPNIRMFWWSAGFLFMGCRRLRPQMLQDLSNTLRQQLKLTKRIVVYGVPPTSTANATRS